MIIDASVCTLASLILASLYFLVLVAVFVGLNRLKALGQSQEIPRVSVVVAARNERTRILPCLESLERLDYPVDFYEIVIVDDASIDGTGDVVKTFCNRHDNWRFISVQQKSTRLMGKKNALSKGIANSNGDLIFVTDADCMVPPQWLRQTVRYFTPPVSMVLGYSPLVPGNGAFYKLLEFDNLFSAVSLAAPTKVGYPFASVGRNLAYRKQSYNRVGGYHALKKFRSGDDTHMTERFRTMREGRVDFCAHPATFVQTYPPATGKDIFFQQIRKNSKILLKTKSSVLFTICFFFSYMSLFVLPFLLPAWRSVWLAMLGARFVIEFICLTKAALVFNQTKSIKFFPLMQLLYPLYNVFFSTLGLFQLYRWKK